MSGYRVFKRRAWKHNPAYPGGFEPNGGARKTTVCHVDSIDEARAICEKANANRPTQGKAYYNFVWTEFERE